MYTDRKDYVHAIADFDEATRLNLRIPILFIARGLAHQGR